MSITLNTLVFSFAGFVNGGISRYLNKDASVPLGFRTLTAKVDEPNGDGMYKVRWKLKLPVVVSAEECACPDGLVREEYVDIVVSIPRTSTATERSGMAVSLQDLAASPEFQASISSLTAPSA